MKRRIAVFLTAILMPVIWTGPICRGEAAEIDRLLAAVNGKVITQSDLQMARTLNALLIFGRDPSKLSMEEGLDRLIDMELIRQELESFPLAPRDESGTEARMAEMRQGYAEIGGLPVLLSRLGLQESELQAYIRLQAITLRFISLRFRPFVTVSPEEVKSYYEEVLVPRLREEGSSVPPLSEISARIEEVLTEEKVNDSMDRWIRNIRRHTRIELFLDRAASKRETEK